MPAGFAHENFLFPAKRVTINRKLFLKAVFGNGAQYLGKRLIGAVHGNNAKTDRTGHSGPCGLRQDHPLRIKVWKGAEANIVDYEGRIDLTEHTLGRLECIVASFHEQTFKAGTVEQHTNAYMQALKNPKIHIFATDPCFHKKSQT